MFVFFFLVLVIGQPSDQDVKPGTSFYIFYPINWTLQIVNIKLTKCRHSSVVSSTPTILRPRVRNPSTPSTLSICIIEIVIGIRKERK